MYGWIGVDLDGTLAHYDGWVSIEHIGEPIPLMVNRVLEWIEDGRDVRIFTARAAHDPDGNAVGAIEDWCEKYLGKVLPVTNKKDYEMIELWDDRAIAVEHNTGRIDHCK